MLPYKAPKTTSDTNRKAVATQLFMRKVSILRDRVRLTMRCALGETRKSSVMEVFIKCAIKKM